MKITPDTFAHLTHYLKGLANGKVMVLLEVNIFVFFFFLSKLQLNFIVIFFIFRVVIVLRP